MEFNPREVIAAVLAGLVDMNPPPRAMHGDLKPWHVLCEGGHHVVVAADPGDLGDDPSVEMLIGQLLPAPVRTVERVGWRVEKGFLVSPVPLDPELGLAVPEEDEEPAGPPAAADLPLAVMEVGAPYPTPLPWQDGAAQLTLAPRGVRFVLPLRSPTEPEVHAVRKGSAEFALVPADRYLLWVYRFSNPGTSNPAASGLPWADTPWEYHRQTQPAPGLPGEEGQTFQLQLVLVDAATNIIRALRVITPPVEFADAVRAAVKRQASRPNETARAGAEIQRLYARYPTSADLLPLAEARFEALRDGTK